MSITGPSSYLSTTDSFIAHWISANASLGDSEAIVLANSTYVTDLIDLRNQLEADRAAVESARNHLEGARADIHFLKSNLLDRLNQFNGKMRSLAAGTRWETMLPKAYTITEGMGRILPPLDEISDLWERYQAEAGSLTLRDGYLLTAFKADLANLKTAYTAWSKADVSLGLARGARNERQARIYEILKQYRQRLPVEFAPGSAIAETLPRLTPLPGNRPDSVSLSGSYDETTRQADLFWTEVTDKDVSRLEIRGTVGPDYDPDDETVLATFAPGDPRAWSGSFGLLVPGSSATFKIYSLTAGGHERGSNAVTVVRPAR